MKHMVTVTIPKTEYLDLKARAAAYERILRAARTTPAKNVSKAEQRDIEKRYGKPSKKYLKAL